MHQVEKSFAFGNDDAVSFGVALSFDKVNSVGDFFCLREVVVSAVLVGAAHNVRGVKFHGVSVFGRDENLRIREVLDGRGMVRVLVRDENFGDLLGLVAKFCKRFHVVFLLFAHVKRCAEFFLGSGVPICKPCIDEDDFAPGVDEKVLQAAAVDNLLVELVFAFFTAKGKRLVHETMVKHAYGFNFHMLPLLKMYAFIPIYTQKVPNQNGALLQFGV